jgi:hypothetical protein
MTAAIGPMHLQEGETHSLTHVGAQDQAVLQVSQVTVTCNNFNHLCFCAHGISTCDAFSTPIAEASDEMMLWLRGQHDDEKKQHPAAIEGAPHKLVASSCFSFQHLQ